MSRRISENRIEELAIEALRQFDLPDRVLSVSELTESPDEGVLVAFIGGQLGRVEILLAPDYNEDSARRQLLSAIGAASRDYIQPN